MLLSSTDRLNKPAVFSALLTTTLPPRCEELCHMHIFHPSHSGQCLCFPSRSTHTQTYSISHRTRQKTGWRKRWLTLLPVHLADAVTLSHLWQKKNWLIFSFSVEKDTFIYFIYFHPFSICHLYIFPFAPSYPYDPIWHTFRTPAVCILNFFVLGPGSRVVYPSWFSYCRSEDYIICVELWVKDFVCQGIVRKTILVIGMFLKRLLTFTVHIEAKIHSTHCSTVEFNVGWMEFLMNLPK